VQFLPSLVRLKAHLQSQIYQHEKMSQQTGSGRHAAGSSSAPHRYALLDSATPRWMPPLNTPGAPARSGTGQMSHYQLSSSHRGQVTNTDHYCVIAYCAWACGHETSKTRRHHLCWKCSDLDIGHCSPEPVEIDKTSECAKCKARRKEERKRLEQERATARDRERQKNWRRERSPQKGRSRERTRSF
jgi:hypothetical protein